MSWYYLNVTVHVLAALLWLGGMFFFAAVGAPTIRRIEPPELRAKLFSSLGTQFRRVGWIAIAGLVLTGLLNLHFRGMLAWTTLGDGSFWTTPYGHALAWKLVSVATMIVISAIHDFVVGPASARVRAGTPEALKLRRQAAWLGRINAIVGIVLVVAAVRLARGG
ncbi:MAG TPA: DUF4149 domain-containing protein [Longimicrobiales bacterium]|nr:DUF4149 domain-containing protein [Longimicrobiales bacterium]